MRASWLRLAQHLLLSVLIDTYVDDLQRVALIASIQSCHQAHAVGKELKLGCFLDVGHVMVGQVLLAKTNSRTYMLYVRGGVFHT